MQKKKRELIQAIYVAQNKSYMLPVNGIVLTVTLELCSNRIVRPMLRPISQKNKQSKKTNLYI
uniref:Uncharacterized protein n=1 Tax=Oryza brachyantha TaxID=4533 RepID=J3LAH1_ORYBR